MKIFHDKIVEWNCPYCDGLAKGFHAYLFDNVIFNRFHSCAFCGNYYKVGIEKDNTLRITAKMETLLKYMIKNELIMWKRLTITDDKVAWCRNRIKEKLAERYGYIGSIQSLLALDEL
jgi:hypothetical protein